MTSLRSASSASAPSQPTSTPTAVDVWHELRATHIGPMRAPRMPWYIAWLSIIGMALGFFAVYLVITTTRIGIVHYAGHDRISNLAILVACLPLAIAGGVIKVRYQRWQDRGGSELFAFPVHVDFPSWRVFRRIGDDALYLTDGTAMIGLFAREGRESLEAVLAVIDPGNELEMDDEKPMSVDVDLDGPAPAVGVLQRATEPGGYVLVLCGDRERASVLTGKLSRAKARYPGDPMQRFRPLEPAVRASRARSISARPI